MERVERTVFISYRRTNFPWAIAIYQNLTNSGYDVFIDYDGIASGDFENVIIGNINSRAHFLVLLTPSALERCSEPEDWLRREIETALESKRNIVPIMLEGFSFGTPAIATQLTGALTSLKKYNALDIPPSYFLEAMERLRTRYLNVALTAVLHPVSASAQQAATAQKAAADAAPAVQEEELTAQQYFERGYAATDPDEQLRFYNEAIRLKPDYALAFFNLGVMRQEQGDLDAALAYYNQAVQSDPHDPDTFYNRGITRKDRGELDAAIADFDEVIRLNPNYTAAFYNRGVAGQDKGDLDAAIADFDEAIRLDPDPDTFNNRGTAHRDNGDLDAAIADYNEAIRLNPEDPDSFYNRGLARQEKGDLDGAVADYNEAIRLNPDYSLAFYNRAELLENQNQYAAAIADYQQYLKLRGGERDDDTAEVEQRIKDLMQRL